MQQIQPMKKNLLLLTLFFIHNALLAQWTNVTNQNTLVSDDAQFDETLPMAAASVNGYTFISWFQANGSGSYNAMLQLLDSNGYAHWPNPLVVSANPQSSALFVHDFNTDHDGNALFAFQDIRNGNTETVIYKIDTAGNFVWGANGIPLHDANATFEAAPKIAVFDNNDVAVAWSASASGNKWVAWQIIDASGISLFPAPQTIDSPTVNFSRPFPVITSDGNIMLVYVQETGNFPGLTSLLFVQKYLANGNPGWVVPTPVSSYGLGFVSNPLVVSDNNGGCYIGFNCGTPSAPSINTAFVQHIGPFGVPSFAADGLELCALNANHKFVKDLCYRSSDNTLYCALKVTDGGQSASGVYAQSLDANASLNFGNNALEVVPISMANPCEAFTIDDAGNGLILAYTEGGFNNQQIKAHKINYNGSILFPAPITLSDAASGKSRVTSNQMNNAQLIVAWEDTRLNAGVYAQNMSPDGNLGIITSLVVQDEKTFQLYLAPNQEVIIINASSKEQIQLMTSDGKLLQSYQITAGQQQIDVSALPAGMYFYQTQSGKSGKIIKS